MIGIYQSIPNPTYKQINPWTLFDRKKLLLQKNQPSNNAKGFKLPRKSAIIYFQ